MARPVTFEASYAGIGEMLRSSEMQKAMGELGERVKARGEADAPVGDPAEDPHSGRYKASFSVTTGVQHRTTARAYAEVANTSPEASFVEYGDSEHDGYHTLLNALGAVRE